MIQALQLPGLGSRSFGSLRPGTAKLEMLIHAPKRDGFVVLGLREGVISYHNYQRYSLGFLLLNIL